MIRRPLISGDGLLIEFFDPQGIPIVDYISYNLESNSISDATQSSQVAKLILYVPSLKNYRRLSSLLRHMINDIRVK